MIHDKIESLLDWIVVGLTNPRRIVTRLERKIHCKIVEGGLGQLLLEKLDAENRSGS